jgi:spoIIIJ-associated protein
MASTEFTAPDVESAIAQGLAQLGLIRADVRIEILDEGAKGVLGIGARQARVRLTPYEDTVSSPAPKTQPAPQPRASTDDDGVDDDDARDGGDFDDELDDDLSDDADENGDDQGDFDEDDSSDEEATDEAVDGNDGAPMIEGQDFAVEIVRNILDKMGFKRATANGRSLLPMDDADQPSIRVDIDVEERDEEGFLAHNGEALQAMQTIVQTMWSHKTKSNVRINLDVNGYKARRQEKLMNMATRMAERVVESGRPITLEPMPAFDRRIVHMVLRDHPQVYTQSMGEGASRKVQIKLKDARAE